MEVRKWQNVRNKESKRGRARVEGLAGSMIHMIFEGRAGGSLCRRFWCQKRRFKARKCLFLGYLSRYINIIAWPDPELSKIEL